MYNVGNFAEDTNNPKKYYSLSTHSMTGSVLIILFHCCYVPNVLCVCLFVKTVLLSFENAFECTLCVSLMLGTMCTVSKEISILPS